MQSDRTTDLLHEASVAAASAFVRLKPTGFFSYSRQDDELSGGKLSKLRALLLAEIQQQYGRDRVQLFQDVSAISHGADWESEIRASLDKSTFFIPIITPNFVQSEWCCAEVTIFLQREKKLFERFPDLPRKSRVFPIHLIDVSNVDAYDRHVLQALETRQWMDFRPLRFKPLSEPEVHQTLASLAASIREMLTVKVRKPLTAKERAAAAEASAASARAPQPRPESTPPERPAPAPPPAQSFHRPEPPQPEPERTVLWVGKGATPAPPPPQESPRPAPELRLPSDAERADAEAHARYEEDVRAFHDAQSDWIDHEEDGEDESPAIFKYLHVAGALAALMVIAFVAWTFWPSSGAGPVVADAPREKARTPAFENYSWIDGTWSEAARCRGVQRVFVATRDGRLIVTTGGRTTVQRVIEATFPAVRTETAIYTSAMRAQPAPAYYSTVNRIRVRGAERAPYELRRC